MGFQPVVRDCGIGPYSATSRSNAASVISPMLSGVQSLPCERCSSGRTPDPANVVSMYSASSRATFESQGLASGRIGEIMRAAVQRVA
jgi:hypothetical protein